MAPWSWGFWLLAPVQACVSTYELRHRKSLMKGAVQTRPMESHLKARVRGAGGCHALLCSAEKHCMQTVSAQIVYVAPMRPTLGPEGSYKQGKISTHAPQGSQAGRLTRSKARGWLRALPYYYCLGLRGLLQYPCCLRLQGVA